MLGIISEYPQKVCSRAQQAGLLPSGVQVGKTTCDQKTQNWALQGFKSRNEEVCL